MKLSDLKVGDVLLPKRATVPQKVTVITYHLEGGSKTDRVKHVNTQPMLEWRGLTYKTSSSYGRTFYSDYDLDKYNYDGNVNEAQGNTTMSKLFKVINEEVYGIHIGTNTAGELVLEIRGDANNSIKAFKKELLEEVKPYTVKLVCVSVSGTNRHVTAEKGKLNKLDVVLWNQLLWTVVELDTKQDNCAELNSKNAKRLVVGEL
jgi:hypothetical protein